MQLAILLNNEPYQIGQPPPTKIEYMNISYRSHPLLAQRLQHTEALLLKQWLNTVIDNLALADGYCTYNGTLYQQKDLVKFTL